MLFTLLENIRERPFRILEGFISEYYHFVALWCLRLILSNISVYQFLAFAMYSFWAESSSKMEMSFHVSP